MNTINGKIAKDCLYIVLQYCDMESVLKCILLNKEMKMDIETNKIKREWNMEECKTLICHTNGLILKTLLNYISLDTQILFNTCIQCNCVLIADYLITNKISNPITNNRNFKKVCYWNLSHDTKWLISNNFKIDPKLLCYTTKLEYTEIVKFLLKQDQISNEIPEVLYNPIHIACKNGCSHVLDILIRIIETTTTTTTTTTRKRDLHYRYTNWILVSIKHGHLNVFKKLFPCFLNTAVAKKRKNKPLLDSLRNNSIEKFILCAANNNHLNFVEYFMDYLQGNGKSYKNAELIKKLSSVLICNTLFQNVSESFQACEIAKNDKNLELFQSLLDNSNTHSIPVKILFKFLELFFGNESNTEIKALLENTKFTVFHDELLEFTAFEAARHKNFIIVGYLLENKKFQTSIGWEFDLLTSTCLHGHLDLLKFLLFEKHMEISKAFFNDLFLKTCEQGHLNVIQFLLELNEKKGLDLNLEMAVFRAITDGQENTVSFLLKNSKKLNFQSSPNTINFLKAIFTCMKKKYVGIIELLLLYDSENGPLHEKYELVFSCACKHGYLKVIQFLLETPRNCLTHDSLSEGLYDAVYNGHYTLVKYLLETLCPIYDLGNCCKLGLLGATKLGRIKMCDLLSSHIKNAKR